MTESAGDVGDGIVAGRERGPGGQLYGDEVAGADVEQPGCFHKSVLDHIQGWAVESEKLNFISE